MYAFLLSLFSWTKVAYCLCCFAFAFFTSQHLEITAYALTKTFIFFLFFFKWWNRVNLQCCVSFRCTAKWFLSIYILFKFFSIIGYSVQFSRSVVSDSATPWTAAHQSSLSITNAQSLFKLMSSESVMPSKYIILCWPLLLLPSIFPSIRVFPNESALHIRWPKYWSFSFNISPSNEHPGLISFRMDWLDLLAVQGTQESSPTPQFKSINFSALSFLYSPTLTSIRDHWKNDSPDY